MDTLMVMVGVVLAVVVYWTGKILMVGRIIKFAEKGIDSVERLISLERKNQREKIKITTKAIGNLLIETIDSMFVEEDAEEEKDPG